MASRIRWLVLGVGVGSYLSLKARSEIISRVENASPNALVKRASQAAKSLNSDLRESIYYGVETVREERAKPLHLSEDSNATDIAVLQSYRNAKVNKPTSRKAV